MMVPPNNGALSIGALSAATGVPTETIRTWERRYGYPVAERKPSGHRVYPMATVSRLRLMSQALARGHRAAEVVGASETALEALLAAVPGLPEPDTPDTVPSPENVSEFLDAIHRFDADRLRRAFQTDWARFGPITFLEHRAAPLLAAVGDAWARGVLDVRHEHFASMCLGDFLRMVRAPYDERARGPVLALATLPGELHGLGLQMAALVVALTGRRGLILGVDTPPGQIVSLAREVALEAVGLSFAPPRRRETPRALVELRDQLPDSVSLVVGGGGAPRQSPQAGIDIVPTLGDLDTWLRSRSPKH
ncbi:MAG: cobalamin B12-binding domain-containing protein [Gemmatimonadales bacterium]|nr:cobalamin B12-binding domain-containing protein [Gemmatimonadales bacterium]